MSKVKPEGMTDEMWAAVQIVMEDQQISSFKQLTESHQAVITRMDQMENKWAETQAHRDTGGEAGSEGQGPADSAGDGGSGGSGGGPQSGGEGSPPPVVEAEVDEGPRGSGRGGKPRWYEREGYAK
jgi:hypothetical protein